MKGSISIDQVVGVVVGLAIVAALAILFHGMNVSRNEPVASPAQ